MESEEFSGGGWVGLRVGGGGIITLDRICQKSTKAKKENVSLAYTQQNL